MSAISYRDARTRHTRSASFMPTTPPIQETHESRHRLVFASAFPHDHDRLTNLPALRHVELDAKRNRPNAPHPPNRFAWKDDKAQSIVWFNSRQLCGDAVRPNFTSPFHGNIDVFADPTLQTLERPQLSTPQYGSNRSDLWEADALSIPPCARLPVLSSDPILLSSHERPSFAELEALPQIPPSLIFRPDSAPNKTQRPPFLSRFSSLDGLIQHREEAARKQSQTCQFSLDGVQSKEIGSTRGSLAWNIEKTSRQTSVSATTLVAYDEQPISQFRHRAADYGFRLSIALAGFLSEYLITGFAIELYRMTEQMSDGERSSSSSTGMFWPATLLSLISGALLLVFARVSDMYGGYYPFMFGMLWLAIWSVVAGFASCEAVLSTSRAMQGLGIAAFTPAVNTMLGHVYRYRPDRKSLVLGIYAGFAPVGFFGGLFVASALPDGEVSWYFWITAILALIALMTAFLTVPTSSMDTEEHGLRFDWLGSILITAGLILVSYSLAAESKSKGGFASLEVLCTLLPGIGLLLTAVWVEGWIVECPLLPRDFFTEKGVVPTSLACLCFYACYGVWLYYSAEFFQSSLQDNAKKPVTGIELALWYLPTAAGGLVLCIAGGYVLHIVRAQYVLFVSAIAWIGAPLLLVVCPIPIKYWEFVMPSMLCATVGLDLTYLVSLSYLTDLRDLKHQGFAGAYCSILINLGMSFSLSIGEIVTQKAEDSIAGANGDALASNEMSHWGFQAAFTLATSLAGFGMIIVFLFVRIPGQTQTQPHADAELRRPRADSEATLVESGLASAWWKN